MSNAGRIADRIAFGGSARMAASGRQGGDTLGLMRKGKKWPSEKRSEKSAGSSVVKK